MTAGFVVRFASPDTVAAESASGERSTRMRAMIRIGKNERLNFKKLLDSEEFLTRDPETSSG
jgi:hypothetical protein